MPFSAFKLKMHESKIYIRFKFILMNTPAMILALSIKEFPSNFVIKLIVKKLRQ